MKRSRIALAKRSNSRDYTEEVDEQMGPPFANFTRPGGRTFELGRGINVTSLLANHADSMFFPNVRELLKVLAVLPLGSTEAERSFSCVRRVHNWLQSTMSTDRLADLAVIAVNGQVDR